MAITPHPPFSPPLPLSLSSQPASPIPPSKTPLRLPSPVTSPCNSRRLPAFNLGSPLLLSQRSHPLPAPTQTLSSPGRSPVAAAAAAPAAFSPLSPHSPLEAAQSLTPPTTPHRPPLRSPTPSSSPSRRKPIPPKKRKPLSPFSPAQALD